MIEAARQICDLTGRRTPMMRTERLLELVKALEHALGIAEEINNDVAISLIERALEHAHTIVDLRSPSSRLHDEERPRDPSPFPNPYCRYPPGQIECQMNRPQVEVPAKFLIYSSRGSDAAFCLECVRRGR